MRLHQLTASEACVSQTIMLTKLYKTTFADKFTKKGFHVNVFWEFCYCFILPSVTAELKFLAKGKSLKDYE